MLANVIRGRVRKPRRILLYGTHGIGKSSWAAQAWNPIFIPTEDGLADIDCAKFPLCRSYGDVVSAISVLATEDHEFKTVVLDSLDWTEQLVQTKTAEDEGKGNIEEFGFGKGYTKALKHWSFILSGLNYLRDTKGMSVILLAHARVVRFQAPDQESYDRYEPDLHKSVCSVIQEWCDEVFFATYRTNTIKREEKFGQERTRAIGTGERIVWTTEMPTHLAKRRIPLPDVIPLDFSVYAQHLAAAYGKTAGDIAGIVNNGSSKPAAETATA